MDVGPALRASGLVSGIPRQPAQPAGPATPPPATVAAAAADAAVRDAQVKINDLYTAAQNREVALQQKHKQLEVRLAY